MGKVGMKINLDIKTLITIISFAAMMGGFYYTTQSRLNSLETEVTKLQKQVKRVIRRNSK